MKTSKKLLDLAKEMVPSYMYPTTPPPIRCGVVVSSGKMMKAVKVRTTVQIYNNFLQKHFKAQKSYFVSDPNDSLRTGDVIRFAGGWPTSRHIKHVVVEILAPWGPPVEERPRIPSEAERIQKRLEKRERKLDRRRRRREGESESEMEIEENGEARQESESKPKSNETQELNTS